MATVEQTESGKKKIVSKGETERLDDSISKPGKYEITKEDEFKIDFYVIQREGRWIVSDKDVFDKKCEKHWVKFRFWTFDEEVMLRKKVTGYDPVKRLHLIDVDSFNRAKVQALLKDWSFAEQNPRLKVFHVNGVLVDESWEVFSKKIHPNISRYIVDRMNMVLEYNG